MMCVLIWILILYVWGVFGLVLWCEGQFIVIISRDENDNLRHSSEQKSHLQKHSHVQFEIRLRQLLQETNSTRMQSLRPNGQLLPHF